MGSLIDLKGYGWSILVEGTALTVEVALASLALSVILGILGAAAKLSGRRVLMGIATFYTTLIRSVPDLVLMLLLFFGGQTLINWAAPKFGYEDYIDIDPFMAGVLVIGFMFGAYMTESFRGALIAIPRGQIEAARAYGMSPLLLFRRITLPQMIRLALPSFGNNWMVLLKTTALVSVIGLDDMVHRAGSAAGATRQPFTFYLVVAVDYLVLTTISVLVLNWLARRYDRGYARRSP
ncbi:arginine/ornithine transport system permease protein [Arboricoccus pini]|uniref:Arginine/ornithine transport system permease protein n=1 Tax=Arboricoccus pini TaxID=1963835 RepID=A0A212RWB7_9PROT|nr:ABC transporter permease [Arboricoccus pini]SNB77068.1 arginine/ornithine transport system permease protein [Arboricoccus pini]